MTPTFQLSRDSQALFMTVVAKDRLPVFKTDLIKLITCRALDEARKSGGFLIFAYVIMLDHIHILTDCPHTSADVLRYVKGLTARRVIDHLKEHGYEKSLTKLRHDQWKRKHTYSLWQQEKNVLSIFSEAMFMQKVNYIHQNPVRAEMCDAPVDYRWSSARFWRRLQTDDEPLKVDFDRIAWRRAWPSILGSPIGRALPFLTSGGRATVRSYDSSLAGNSHLINQHAPAVGVHIYSSFTETSRYFDSILRLSRNRPLVLSVRGRSVVKRFCEVKLDIMPIAFGSWHLRPKNRHRFVLRTRAHG